MDNAEKIRRKAVWDGMTDLARREAEKEKADIIKWAIEEEGKAVDKLKSEGKYRGCLLYTSSCFSCHLECAIRQQDCYGVEAPMGNPFPCEMVPKIPELREKIGAGCQMVNHDLAYHRVGDHEPVPCCKECIAPCEYMCSRARNARGSAARCV